MDDDPSVPKDADLAYYRTSLQQLEAKMAREKRLRDAKYEQGVWLPDINEAQYNRLYDARMAALQASVDAIKAQQRDSIRGFFRDENPTELDDDDPKGVGDVKRKFDAVFNTAGVKRKFDALFDDEPVNEGSDSRVKRGKGKHKYDMSRRVMDAYALEYKTIQGGSGNERMELIQAAIARAIAAREAREAAAIASITANQSRRAADAFNRPPAEEENPTVVSEGNSEGDDSAQDPLSDETALEDENPRRLQGSGVSNRVSFFY
jgi:hypothetical protein